jgi:hypothetical protein
MTRYSGFGSVASISTIADHAQNIKLRDRRNCRAAARTQHGDFELHDGDARQGVGAKGIPLAEHLSLRCCCAVNRAIIYLAVILCSLVRRLKKR